MSLALYHLLVVLFSIVINIFPGLSSCEQDFWRVLHSPLPSDRHERPICKFFGTFLTHKYADYFFFNIDFPVKMYYNLKRFQLWNIMCFTTLPTCWEGVGWDLGTSTLNCPKMWHQLTRLESLAMLELQFIPSTPVKILFHTCSVFVSVHSFSGYSDKCLMLFIDELVFGLQESLDEVTVKDMLEGDNMYTCSKCQKKVRAEKRFGIMFRMSISFYSSYVRINSNFNYW